MSIQSWYACVKDSDAGMGVHDGGTSPCPLKGGTTGAQVPLNNSIIGTFRDARERWNDGGIAPWPFEQGGTRLFGRADSAWPFRSESFWLRDIWVWPFPCGDISVTTFLCMHKELITFVYWSDYMGRRNITLAGVIPSPLWGVMIAVKSEL